MAKKDDLLLDSIKNASDIEIPFVIVFTYLDEYVETFKREDKAWRDFEKKYQTDNPKANYHHIEDINIDFDDDEEPYKDKPIAMVTKESLSAISENDKATLEFGIRVVDTEANVARVFSQEMLDYYGIEYVLQKVEFDDVESTIDDIMEQTKQLSQVAGKQNETKETQELNKVQETAENNKNDVSEVAYTSGDEEEIQELESTDDTEANIAKDNSIQEEDSNVSEDEQLQNPTPITAFEQNTEEEIADISEQNKQYLFDLEHKQPKTPMDYAKQDILHELSEKINPITLPRLNHIPDDTLGNLTDSKSYDKFLALKRITEDKFIKRTESVEKTLNNLRRERLMKINNKLVRRLSIENDELLRKSDFTSDYSPFNEVYQTLKARHQEIVDALPETKYQEIEKNKQQHETNKKAYVERAAHNAAQEYDQRNLHLIDENAQHYIDDIKKKADNEYNDNYKKIEQDAQNWYVMNFNTLVPKILQSYQEEIEQVANGVSSEMKQAIEDMNKKNEDDINYLIKQFQDITYKEIETDENNKALIDKEVHERTLEYPEFKHKIEMLKKEIEQINKENDEAFETKKNLERDLLEERKRNEALEKSLENRSLDFTNASDNYRELQKIMADGNVEKLQRIIDKNKVESLKPTLAEKIKGLGNIIAAAIIAIAIVIAAILFSGGSGNADERGVSQNEVKAEVQKAVEDNNKKHEETQKESDEKIKQLENDLEKAKKDNKK
ncbi:hypothetical protein NAC36_002420 [Staphylococcus pseudintermedius]|uniref:hypothetical protein n=11 Tax=Staphylococcus pseudintermedius TaxID=283734 RepID=UPI000BBBEFE9|nr:hypothetical protein [Staphylococcus pseudintermedius]EGQ2899960.1 hypothetical protein [Staphylococcus pseudintermedius]EGQ3075933.1 hypothetical protein [Staphylococcus pseudintermedius]EGQ3318384.1 hypothetical protein [Staphylococcus pseudintermedius]EGQ3374949.1 hypothetical protein [Staphylococcus pseudintermedius]EGQ3382387.1 hypothetical protein [Staphylococcus pseudintermedius]